MNLYLIMWDEWPNPHNSLIRLEEKITNLESENQVLRQQALSMAPNKFLSGRSRSIIRVLLSLEWIL